MVDEKRESRIRYTAVFAVLLLLYAGCTGFLLYTRLPGIIAASRISEHIELYRNGAEEMAVIEIPRVLYSVSGPAEVTAEIPSYGRDLLHLAAEAALLPPDEEELERGLVSYIPEGVELIGISERAGYIFIDLSKEMETAGERAFEEIRRSIALSFSYEEIVFMIEGVRIGS